MKADRCESVKRNKKERFGKNNKFFYSRKMASEGGFFPVHFVLLSLSFQNRRVASGVVYWRKMSGMC